MDQTRPRRSPRMRGLWLCAFAIWSVIGAAVAGQTLPTALPTAPAGDPAPPPAAALTGLTGDWGGLRTRLEDRGYSFGGFLRLDISRCLAGGISTTETALRDLLDLNLTIDTEKAFALPGGKFQLDFQSHSGRNATEDLVGDTQGFDNQDGPVFSQIDQLWYQQQVVADKLRLKVGKMDANTDFSVLDHGTEFLGSSMTYSPAIFTLPTYPNPAPGGELFFTPNAQCYASVGAFYSNDQQRTLIFSGHPERVQRADGGAFLIAELGYRWGVLNRPGHAGLGAWAHTGEFPRFAGGTMHGTQGLYGLFEQSIGHVEGKEGVRDLGFFIHGGVANPAVSPVAHHLGAGVAATGLLSARLGDVFGLGVNWARLGDAPGQRHDAETAVELFYKFQIVPGLNLKPDVQYIRHPGGGDAADAVVATVRAEMSF